MTPNKILSIGLDEPEKLFPDPEALHKRFRDLAKKWHPDVNPGNAAVFGHIQKLYTQARRKKVDGTWMPAGSLIIDGVSMWYRAKRSFELGTAYIGLKYLTYVIDRKHENLVISGLRGIGSMTYPDDYFRLQVERYFPFIERHLEDETRIAVVMRKHPDEVCLSDLINHCGGKLEPCHTAWILSSLYNLASSLELAELTHNGISPNTVFVNPVMHSASIYGGWWYSEKVGKKLTNLPPETYKLAPRKFLAKKKGDPVLDLECIKAIGRICLGDPSGGNLRDASLPSWAPFLMLPAGKSAVADYENWMTFLEKAGPRKFIKMNVTLDDIYPK